MIININVIIALWGLRLFDISTVYCGSYHFGIPSPLFFVLSFVRCYDTFCAESVSPHNVKTLKKKLVRDGIYSSPPPTSPLGPKVQRARKGGT